jgi:hypothetical protein
MTKTALAIAIALGLAGVIAIDFYPVIALAGLTVLLAVSGWQRSPGLALVVTIATGVFLALVVFALVRNCALTPGYVCSTDPGSWGAPLLVLDGILALASLVIAVRYRGRRLDHAPSDPNGDS